MLKKYDVLYGGQKIGQITCGGEYQEVLQKAKELAKEKKGNTYDENKVRVTDEIKLAAADW